MLTNMTMSNGEGDLKRRSDAGISAGWAWVAQRPANAVSWIVREWAPRVSDLDVTLPASPTVAVGLNENDARRMADWHNSRMRVDVRSTLPEHEPALAGREQG